MKKIFSLVIAMALVFACVVSANAATGITAEEQKIIDALSKKITMASGSVVEIPDNYINQAEDYLTKADLTPAEINQIITDIEEAAEVLEKSDVATFDKLNATAKNAIIDKVKDAAEVIDAVAVVKKGDKADNYVVKLTFTDDSTVPGYTANDAAVELPIVGNNVVKQTGVEGNMMAVIVTSSVVMMGLAFVFISARKKVTD